MRPSNVTGLLNQVKKRILRVVTGVDNGTRDASRYAVQINRVSSAIAGAALLLLNAAFARAQSIPGAVLAKREPHHHLVYEDSTLRVLRVRVPGHDTTLLHEHDPDYFWIALGKSTVINAKPGLPDATITSSDLSVHYTPGKFAHVARNPGDAPFDNITVELLEPQRNVRNACEAAIADQPLDCPARATPAFFSGATERPAFATDRLRASLVNIAPGGVLRATERAKRVWIIALDSADANRGLVIDGTPKWVGGVFQAQSARWTVRNRGRAPIRVIAVVKQ